MANIVDWQAWAADVSRQLTELKTRVSALESKPSGEVQQQLIAILTAIGVTDQKVNAMLNRQEKLKLQIEKLAESVLEEAELAKMLSSLQESEKALDKAVKEQGPE